MTDEELDELLSRELDGDLGPPDAARLASLVAADARLAARRAALIAIQQAVAAISLREDVPHRLELLMEPLRREDHGPRSHLRSWLAAAAALVAAVLLAASLAHRATTTAGGDEAPAVASAERVAPSEHDRRRGGGSELHNAATRGRLPTMPAADEPAPLDVIGPLPFPPDVYGGRLAVLALPNEVSIPLRVPASCPPGVHSVLASSSSGDHSELELRATPATELSGCTPLVVLDPVPAGLGPTPARLVVES